MNVEDLALEEMKLLSQTLELAGTMEEKGDKVVYFGISSKYSKVHMQYSQLAENSLEALKRGVFISWYALTEPMCYTGIGNLDSTAERTILNALNRRLKNDVTDYELDWMLDYYSNWDFVFERYTELEHLQARMKRSEKVEMPEKINRDEMNQRGQMGYYWNSLTRYSK